MTTQNTTRQFLTDIYGYTFFNSLMMLSPVYAVFMQSHGMTDFDISLLLMLWSGAVLVTQFPIAACARKCGAKHILFIGQILKSIAFILWMIWPCYIGFALGMILWGMHGAIYNVISEDVLYDELRARTHNLTYERVLGRRRSIAALGTALSAAGSLLLVYGYGVITSVSIVSLAISMLFLMRMNLIQDYHGAQSGGTSQIAAIKTALSTMRITPAIIAMLIMSVLVTNFSYLNDYLSLIGLDIGLPPQYIGIVPFFILCCQIAGQSVAHKFTGVKSGALYTGIIAAGALFGVFVWQYNVAGLIALGAAYVICAIIKILLYARFQNLTPTEHRIEILSFYSIADQGSYMIMCFIIGLGSLMGGWRFSVLIMAVLLGMLGIWALAFVRRRYRRANITHDTPQMTVRPSGGLV
ncbi:MAG: MFS transporter [Muribaculaceae bacterium]|nr:MFS transporter [Muribaculaceae bacterium]